MDLLWFDFWAPVPVVLESPVACGNRAAFRFTCSFFCSHSDEPNRSVPLVQIRRATWFSVTTLIVDPSVGADN